MNASQKKQFAVKQDDEDRKNFDKKWERLHLKLRQQDGGFNEPDGKLLSIKHLVPFKQSTLIRDFNDLYQKIYDKEKYINL
jgi:hypothetical protein